MSWNETNQLPLKLFWWQSPDGSRVLAYFPDGYGNADFSPYRLSNDLAHARNLNPGLPTMLDLYGVGDHGGGPTRALLDEGVKRTKTEEDYPKMKFGTAQSYFNQVQPLLWDNSPLWTYRDAAAGATHLLTPPAGKIAIPTWNDELYLEFHRGVFTTQGNHKRNMREGEEFILNAEKYASLAWLDGDAYPAGELTDAWKKVLFNQFHDLGAGSGIGIIYKDAQADYDQVRWATREISEKALRTLSSFADTRSPTTGSIPSSSSIRSAGNVPAGLKPTCSYPSLPAAYPFSMPRAVFCPRRFFPKTTTRMPIICSFKPKVFPRSATRCCT
jgi:alpha-mannosidase